MGEKDFFNCSFLFIFLIFILSFVSSSEFGVKIGNVTIPSSYGVEIKTPTTTSINYWYGNITNFTGLTDTPSSYAGQGGDCVKVGVGEAALEFGDCGTATGITNNTAGWILNFTNIFSKSWLNVTLLWNQIKEPSIYNSTYETGIAILNQTITDSNASWLSTYNTTYDAYKNNVSMNWSILTANMWNESWISTYNFTYASNLDTNWSFDVLNALFNQTPTLTSSNESWLATYNATYVAWVTEINTTIQNSNESWLSTYNLTYANNLDTNETIRVNLLNQTILDSNASWLSTYNATYVAWVSEINTTIQNSNESWLSTYNASYVLFNTTANIQNLLNNTALTLTNFNSSNICISDICIESWDAVNISGGGGGNPFNQNLNTTENVTFGNITLGTSEGDKNIWFYEDGSGIGESLFWDDSADRFEFTDSLIVEALYSGGITGTLFTANSDIFTTGSGDDLWLGTSTQANALFRAYADGQLNVTKINTTFYCIGGACIGSWDSVNQSGITSWDSNLAWQNQSAKFPSVNITENLNVTQNLIVGGDILMKMEQRLFIRDEGENDYSIIQDLSNNFIWKTTSAETFWTGMIINPFAGISIDFGADTTKVFQPANDNEVALGGVGNRWSNLSVGDYASVTGNVSIGENLSIGEDVHIGDSLFSSTKGMIVPLPSAGSSVTAFNVVGQLTKGIFFNRTASAKAQVDFGTKDDQSHYFVELGTESGNAWHKGTLTLGLPSAPKNITLYSQDGTAWSCGVNNDGTLTCS